ncbi:hypothetical protein BG004_003822 [Podila humilis]|nr:hypothetical protein BG004_003822 [Podila humilis]
MLAALSAVKRAATSPQLMGLAKNTNTLRTIVTTRRFQSSSSWSSNNNNNNDLSRHDLASMVSSDNISVNAALGGLHQVDLAHGSFFALHRPLLGITNGPMFAQNHEEFEGKEDYLIYQSTDELSAYFSTLLPFTPPTSGISSAATPVLSYPEAEQAVQRFFEQINGQIQQQKIIVDPLMDESNVMHMTSVLRKRKIKMRKHKYKKLRKRTRALRKKLGK